MLPLQEKNPSGKDTPARCIFGTQRPLAAALTQVKVDQPPLKFGLKPITTPVHRPQITGMHDMPDSL